MAEIALNVGPAAPRRPWSDWLRRLCVGTAFLTLVANLGYWWLVSTSTKRLGVVLPMPPLTAMAFLLLANAFAAALISGGAHWPRRWLIPLSALAAIIVAAAIVFHDVSDLADWESFFDPAHLMFLGAPAGHSRFQAAILIAATSFNLCAVWLTKPMSRGWKTGMICAAGCALLGFLTLVADTAGNPMFAGGGLLGVPPPAALVFMLLNAGLALTGGVAQQLRLWFLGSEVIKIAPASLSEDRVTLQLLGVLGCVALIGVTYLRIQTQVQHDRAVDILRTDIGLKTDQITEWRQEREGDALIIWGSPWYREIASALRSTGLTSDQQAEMAEVTSNFVQVYRYKRTTILDWKMRPIHAYPDQPDLSPGPLQSALNSGLAGRLLEIPPYVDRDGTLLWGYLVRIRLRDSGEIGAYVLVEKELQVLFPHLQAWPKDNATGQSILWLRSDRQLVSLGGLRDTPLTPAADRQPFAITRHLHDLIAAPLDRGETDLTEARNPRGIQVLTASRMIPGSNWLLVSSMRGREVYAPLRSDSWLVVGFSSGLLGLVGFVMARFWRDQQRRLLGERLRAELDQKRTAARLGMVMHEARDIILMTDHELRIVDANQRASQAFGWTREELLTKRIHDLQTLETHAALPDPISRSYSVEEAFFETIYRCRDGSTFPAEASVRQVMIDGQRQALAIIRDISERRQTEAKLRASEERYRLIAENTSDIIWLYDISTKGAIYVSAATLPLLGFSPDELLGEGLTRTLTDESEAKARQIFQQLFDEVQSGGKPRHTLVELEHRHRDGRIVPVEVTSSILPGPAGQPQHILGITRDITERRRAQDTLKRFNADLEQQVERRTAELAVRTREIEALIESIPDTVLVCDEQGGLVTSYFPSARQSIAPFLQPAEKPGSPKRLPVVEEIARETHAMAKAGGRALVLEFDRTIDGAELTIEARAAPVGDNRLLILLRDISARKRLERGVLANLTREKQLSEMKSQFISVASHEFRTPLAAAVGSIELLERHSARLTDAKRSELLERAQRSLGRLTGIMNDVLQVSRADSGQVKVKPMHIDLGRFVQDVVNEVAEGDRGAHIFLFQQSDRPNPVPVDTNLLSHILSNLIGNAARYSPAGTTISITLTLESEAFTVTVADEGIGIPATERERIFEPFVRGSNVGQIGGTGLGLNIVKRYTELMSGRIEVLPTARGATFRVWVPYPHCRIVHATRRACESIGDLFGGHRSR